MIETIIMVCLVLLFVCVLFPFVERWVEKKCDEWDDWDNNHPFGPA